MARTGPNNGLTLGWADREAGWGPGVNADLELVDALLSIGLVRMDLTAPPSSPAPVDGDRYLVGASPTGAWAGQGAKVAVADSHAAGGWRFYAARAGMHAWDAATGDAYIFDPAAGAWHALEVGNLPAGRAFAYFRGTTAEAGLSGALHFKNPAGSGVTAHIYLALIDSAKVGGSEKPFKLVAGPRAADLVGPVDPPIYSAAAVSLDSREDALGVSKCLLSSENAALTEDLPDAEAHVLAVAVDDSRAVEYPRPIVVKPGAGWVWKATVNDMVDLDVSVFWIEQVTP